MNNLIFWCITLVFLLTARPDIFSQQKHKTETNSDIIEYTNKEALPTTNISNMIQTQDGYIWLSGIEGTYRFNGYEFEEVGGNIGLPKMQNMYYDSTKNVMYFASPKKFITFDGKEFKVYTDKEGYKINGLSGQQISFINADSKDRIWIGSSTPFVDKSNNGGLTKFENGIFTVYDSENFPLDNATGFIETPYGDLIFSSTGKNTQTSQGSFVALFKNDIFKIVDESMGVNLQGAILFPEFVAKPVDKDGNTWLAFSGQNNSGSIQTDSGVLMYDGNKFHKYPELINSLGKNRFPLEFYYSTKMDKLFLTTFSLEGEIFNGKNKIIYEYEKGKWKPSGIFEQINTLTNLKTGNVIRDFRFSAAFFQKSNKYFPELLVVPSTDIMQSSKYPNQFFHYNNGKWEKFDAFIGGFGYEINDGILLPTSKGIGIYYPNYSRMLTAKDGLFLDQSSGIITPYTDRDGLVWISYSFSVLPAYALTANVGINVWDGKKNHSITEKDGLASNITFRTIQDSKKRIWISTSKGLTIARTITNSNNEQIFKLNSIIQEDGNAYNISNVMESRQGDIYVWENYVRPASDKLIAAEYFLGKYDGKNIVKINSPFSNSDNSKKFQLFDLRADNEGRLWFFGIFSDALKDITSARSKVMIFDGQAWSEPPKSWDIPAEQLHYVGNLKKGMYFLTVGGFYVFNGKRFVDLSDSVSATADFRILKGASVAGTKTDIQAGGNLYIRLRNSGLVIFDGTNLKYYTKKDGLPSTNLSNPIVDEFRGAVYFSSPSGALKINGNKFQAFYTDESVSNAGPMVSVMDGFGNMVEFYNGVGMFINKSEEKNYPLKISSILINGKINYYDFPNELSYSENSFVFNYAALNYKDPKLTTYEHFLEGFDKEWSKASNLPFAEYQNLPSGDYIFRVRGLTSNGVRTNEASYSFIVNPPMWRAWWAYGIYMIFLGFTLLGIRKFELDRRRERDSKKFLQLENARKSKELEEARQLQLSMLPKSLPNVPHLDIAVFMKTATEVGGDYYDFHVHIDGTLTVVLGDATGHGMMSGMMVSIMKSLFMSDRTNKALKPFFENASAAIKDMHLGRLMMALTCVQIQKDKIVTTNAGMPPLFIYRKNSQTIEEVVINNLPLGAMKEIAYDVKEFKIEKGDTLFMMSDGFAELKNDNKEIYGYKRARNIFEEVAVKEPEEIVTYLHEQGNKWTNGKNPDDDVTFVVIKVK